MDTLPEKVTMRDISEYFQVGYQHVRRMRSASRSGTPNERGSRCQLPEPEVIGNRPVWNREDILKWAMETGRIDLATGEPIRIGNRKPAK